MISCVSVRKGNGKNWRDTGSKSLNGKIQKQTPPSSATLLNRHGALFLLVTWPVSVRATKGESRVASCFLGYSAGQRIKYQG